MTILEVNPSLHRGSPFALMLAIQGYSSKLQKKQLLLLKRWLENFLKYCTVFFSWVVWKLLLYSSPMFSNTQTPFLRITAGCLAETLPRSLLPKLMVTFQRQRRCTEAIWVTQIRVGSVRRRRGGGGGK